MSTDNPNAYGDLSLLRKLLENKQETKVSDRKLRHKYTGTRKGFSEQLKENPVVKQSLTTAKNVTLCGGYN